LKLKHSKSATSLFYYFAYQHRNLKFALYIKSKMSKKKNNKRGKRTVEFFENLEEKAMQSEAFVEKHSKKIVAVVALIVLGILGYFAYDQFVVVPKNAEATQQFLNAQNNLSKGNDSLALGGKSAANPGFLGTYEEYKGTNSGKLAAYNAAILEFNNGKYQRAYDLMDGFKSSNKILTALKFGVMADAKANLKKGDEALSLFDKAISASDDKFTSYYFTRKAGLLALALQNKSAAKKYFSKIEESYLDYDGGASDAYIEMIKYY